METVNFLLGFIRTFMTATEDITQILNIYILKYLDEILLLSHDPLGDVLLLRNGLQLRLGFLQCVDHELEGLVDLVGGT